MQAYSRFPGTPMFASLFIAAGFTAFVAAGIIVSTPTGALDAIQCEVCQVTWVGGTGPFNIRLLDSAQNFVEEITSAATTSPVQWTVNQPAGQVFLFSIHDSNGTTGLTSQFTVQSSSNSACLDSIGTTDFTTETSADQSHPSPTGTLISSTTHISAAISDAVSRATASMTSATTSSASSRLSQSSDAASPTIGSSSPDASKALPTGAIAGIAAGAFSSVLVAMVGIVWIVRRSRNSALPLPDDPNEATTNTVTSVEPFPLTRPGLQYLGPSGAGSSTPVGWERKNRPNDEPNTTTERITSVHPGRLPTSSTEFIVPDNGELSETTFDRLVNQVLRRLQAQEAPPSYPASSQPDSDS